MYRYWTLSGIGISLALTAAAFSLAGCGSQLLKSTWLKPTSVIQGVPDWWNLPAFRSDELGGTLTLMNDSSNFYLRLFSKDHRLAGRIKRAGLTIWLSDRTDRTTSLGIEFPIGMQNGQGAFHPDRYLPQGDIPPAEIDEMLKLQSDDIHIMSEIAQDSGRKTPEQAAQLGINVQLNSNENSVEYILKLDLKQMPDWVRPGKQIRVRVFSPTVERPKFRDGEGRREGGRGMPPMGGDFPGGGRGNRGGHGGERPEERPDMDNRHVGHKAIDYQFILQLALSGTE